MTDLVKVAHIVPEHVNVLLKGVTCLQTIDYSECPACKGGGYMQSETSNEPAECPSCNGRRIVGRTVVFHDERKELRLELQDEGRTLKIFIDKRKKGD